MKETVEARAVKIAARIMQAAGLCRYDSVEKCRRAKVDERTCDKCIRAWLLSKARSELRVKEERRQCINRYRFSGWNAI